jgi:hypothetical protein
MTRIFDQSRKEKLNISMSFHVFCWVTQWVLSCSFHLKHVLHSHSFFNFDLSLSSSSPDPRNELHLYSEASERRRLGGGEPFEDPGDRVTGDECIHLSSSHVTNATTRDHNDSSSIIGNNITSGSGSRRRKEVSNCVQAADNGSTGNSREMIRNTPHPPAAALSLHAPASEAFSLHSQNRRALMARAKRKTLRMSILIVVTFVVCEYQKCPYVCPDFECMMGLHPSCSERRSDRTQFLKSHSRKCLNSQQMYATLS